MTTPRPGLSELDRLLAVLQISNRTQAELAQSVGASQSQVSRILARKIQRPSSTYRRLCAYAFEHDGQSQEAGLSGGDLAGTVIKAWDGSDRHAKLLSGVVQLIGRLGRCQEKCQ